MKKLLLLLSAVGMIFTACQGGLDNEENGGNSSTPKIELSQQGVEVAFESAQHSVSVTSPYSWEATSKNDWIVVDTKSGIAGTKELKFSVKRNEELEIREGTIVIKNEDYNLVAELYVTQTAFVSAITIEPESLTFTSEGGIQEVVITANFEYEYSANADWLTIEKSEKGISVTVPSYVEVDERTAEITISSEKYDVSKVVNVTQNAFVPDEIIIDPESLTFTFEGGTQDVAITANFEYAYSENADWLTIKKSESGIKVTANANANFEERTAEITISSEKYGVSKTIAVTQKGVSAESQRVIIYTSSDGKVVTPYKSDVFGANIVSNTYNNGQGVIIFDAPVTSIGNYAFRGCTSLTSVTIPDSVTSIKYSVFLDCTSLTAFYGKYASADNRCLIANGVLNSFAPAGLTEYTIPDSVTSIGNSVFYNCSSLTSVTIPDSVTSIGNSVFYNCSSLTSVTIPDSVTSIGRSAFDRCTSLTSVTIGNSVTSIGEHAFYGCRRLTSVYCKPTTPPTGDGFMFYNNASGRKIYVPTASVDAYKAAEYWSAYASDIVGYDF